MKQIMNLIFISLIIIVISATVSGTPTQNGDKKQILIIVSYDGFRNEYLQRNVTPHMLELRKNGVYADYMMNVFPTKTFTNHHSIATGFYPDFHGVLANKLYDTQQGPLNYSYELFHYNPDILPIWILNEKFGGNSGCMMWPGSEFNYTGTTCTHVQKYNTSISLKDRVDTVMSWLTDPEKPANLVMLYSEQPDKLAHAIGPESQNITDLIKELDLLTKYIQDQLAYHNLSDHANVIHLSDHGMAGITPQKFINLTEFLEPNTFTMYGTSPVLQVVPTEGKEDDVYKRLHEASIELGTFSIYNHENLPERWHSQNKRRFGPIIAVANMDYGFQDMWTYAEYYNKTMNITPTATTSYGTHGYDNEEELMHPFFMAKGPLLKVGHKIKPFETVDLFSLFTKLLQIEEVTEKNGKLSRVIDIVDEDAFPHHHSVTNVVIVVLIICAIVAAGVSYGFIYYKRRRNYRLT